MVAFAHDCPHCGTRHASFDILHEYRPPALAQEIHAFGKCGVCGKAVAVVFHVLGLKVPQHQFTLNSHFYGHPRDVTEITFYPPPATPEAPDHLPDNVRAFFLEAVDNVKTGPNAAGAMFRKSVDVALKHVAPELKGNLVKRIDKAADARKLTPELAKWAHHVRLEGNDAAHDEDPFTRKEAEALYQITELVLMYLFTLPGMLRDRRGEPPDESSAS